MILGTRIAGPLIPRMLRFGLVGLFATATDFGVFNVGLVFATDPGRGSIIALNTLAFAVATSVSYSLNSRYTFAARRSGSALRRYFFVAVCGAVIYDLALVGGQQFIPAGDIVLLNAAKLGAASLSATWNFVGFSVFAFGARQGRAGTGAAS